MKSHSLPTRRLRRRLGPGVVSTGGAVRLAASFDGAKLSFLPDAVIVPRNRADIAAVLALANRHRCR